ncbi:tumor necrosis factor receptor superfamily member 1B-like isoform X2 [Dendropsophus ebraccatus]|uniref:tumor necrosis factor receptor superfamily member 1B-like isoform X2 n=1 Tax=Dendropsophus ebraccatus TaxID=150705 RepID=UPI003831CCF1
MFFAHIVFVLLMVAGTFQKAGGQKRCQACPQGYVTRSSCVKDIGKECATCSDPNEYIDWSYDRPRCWPCNICRPESNLVEVQSCSLLTEAICQCKPGFYCRTTLPNSCARCNPLRQCPPGQGVKQKGSPNKDTVCEACPSWTFSNVTSATEACKPHTDCNKLHRLTTRWGNATNDAQCGKSIDSNHLQSEKTTLPYIKYRATPVTTTSPRTTAPPATSGTVISTTIVGAAEPGEWSSVYVLAAIMCIISLLIAFFLVWKQKICDLKIWKNFFHPENPARTATDMEENTEEELLWNTNPKSDQRSQTTAREKTTEETAEVPHGRDHMSNRIDKIYIVNADTVVVGSISDVSSRWRPVTPECDSQESPRMVSRYPEQESSKVSGNDLMYSIEEEERESCKAKAILDV